jgi:EAL domain-containing protein (putative c-di-GMP-specific phosphodiesterase class I)/GGDEF domain-containing protein
MTWKAPSRGNGTGLIGKLTQANIDEVAPVDDEIVVVRDDGPATGPLRQRLAASTLLRVREATDIADLAGLTATGRTRAVVLCRSHLSLVELHQAVAAIRRNCPDIAVAVLDDRGGAGREAVAVHAGADTLRVLSEDWKVLGETVLGAADQRAEDRAVGDVIEVTAVEAFARRCEEAWPLALLVLQADNLAAVTARYAGGDTEALMLALAVRLRPVLRPSDLMVRTQDNCLLIARRDADELATAALGDRLLRACRHSLAVGAESVSVTVSVGIAMRGPREDDVDASAASLLEQARVALHRAQGRGQASYELGDSGVQARVMAQHQTEIALRHALDNHEFRVFYQPVVEFETGALTSLEALMRWQRPQIGLFAAASFVEAAQRSGLMARIGQAILREAATEAVKWAAPPSASPALSVNLSPQEYFMPTLTASVSGILAAVGLDPGSLLLEIPAKLLGADSLSARGILRDLADIGVTLVADDYDGELTGELRRLPIRMVKMRMGLLGGIDADDERRRRVAAIVSHARDAGWICIGKGVEDPAQAVILRELGCQGGQGFLFSGARPAEELELFRNPAGAWVWSSRARSRPAS